MSASTTFAFLKLEVDDGVGVITINRPEVLNACDSATHREMQAAIDWAENEESVRTIVITGAGRAFCAGSDLREVGQFQGQAARNYLALDFATKNCIATCRKPVIGALHGHVAGGGFEMALACDLRIAADDVQFSLPEIVLGTIPGSGGLQRLPSIVGLGIAKEWALTGRRVGAAEALQRGLVNAVHSPSELMQAAMTLARSIAERSATALFLAKIAMDPEPPSTRGMVGAFHMLAAEACHADPIYQERAGAFRNKTKN